MVAYPDHIEALLQFDLLQPRKLRENECLVRERDGGGRGRGQG